MCCQATRRRRTHDAARNSRTSEAFLSNCGRSGNYYLFNSISNGGLRLNPVADYQCTEAAISDRISIAPGGGSPLYPAIWGKPGTSIIYKPRAEVA